MSSSRERAEQDLLERLRNARAELESMLAASSNHWGYEDLVYRFDHHSYKVYRLQEQTSAIVAQNLFDNIRSNPRWLPFLRKIGKAPEQPAKIEIEVTLPKSRDL